MVAFKIGPDFWRRLRLYSYGLLIGIVASYFMFGRTGCKHLTPGMLKLDDLVTHTEFQYTDTATCEMKCQQIDTNEVKDAFTYGKVDSKKSRDFHTKTPVFNFSGLTRKGRNLNIICMQIDSITKIIYVHDIAKRDSCKCP